MELNNLVKIFLNGSLLILDQKMNLLQACSLKNIHVPKFCFHDSLSIAGNCRMCLVELKGSLKPIASCAMPVANNMEIFTTTKLVKKAREGVLEFMLINHPLDCPICDQGGECDLQDLSLLYGNDKGRFYDLKRSVKDKDCGPLIKTIMTRCIQCTRCIRYISEITGFSSLGAIGRGQQMEVSQYFKRPLYTELLGNVIDLCPVGALTSKPYSFVARPWELLSFNSIDIQDPMHVNIRVDIRDQQILRVLPSFNKKINNNWISDLTRFSYDGFNKNRTHVPLLKDKKGFFCVVSWTKIINVFKSWKFRKLHFFLGSFLDSETYLLLRYALLQFTNFTVKTFGSISQRSINDFRTQYIMSSDTYDNMFQYQSIIVFYSNLRIENPLLSARLHQYSSSGIADIYTFGNDYNVNYNHYHISSESLFLLSFLAGNLILNNTILKSNKNLFLLDFKILDAVLEFNMFYLFMFMFNFYNVTTSIVNLITSSYMSLELNLENKVNNFEDFSLKNFRSSALYDVVYAINADSIRFGKLNYSKIIFQGSHMVTSLRSEFFRQCDAILPSVNFFEKNGIYVNFFGFTQCVKSILFPLLNSRTDLQVLNMFLSVCNKFYRTIDRFESKKLLNDLNYFSSIYAFLLFDSFYYKGFIVMPNKISVALLTNFYRSTSVAKSSLILEQCSREYMSFYTNFS